MKIVLIVLLEVLVLAPQNAAAGGLMGVIYDTCMACLGEPCNHATIEAPPASDVYAFRKGEWEITVFFWKHQAHLIVYQKTGNARLLSTEIQTILKAYGDGLTWTEDSSGHCTRGDGDVHARITEGMAAIYSQEFDAAASAADQGPGAPARNRSIYAVSGAIR